MIGRKPALSKLFSTLCSPVYWPLTLGIQDSLSASNQRRQPNGRGSSAHARLSPGGPAVKQVDPHARRILGMVGFIPVDQ